MTDWPRASHWLGGDDGGDPTALVVAGVPLTQHAVTPSHYEQAPTDCAGWP